MRTMTEAARVRVFRARLLRITAQGFPWRGAAFGFVPGGLLHCPGFRGPHFGSQRILFPGAHPGFLVFSGFRGPGLFDAFVLGRLRLGTCFHTDAGHPACGGLGRRRAGVRPWVMACVFLQPVEDPGSVEDVLDFSLVFVRKSPYSVSKRLETL